MPLQILELVPSILVITDDDAFINLEGIVSIPRHLEIPPPPDIEQLVFALKDFELENSKIEDAIAVLNLDQVGKKNGSLSSNPFLQDSIRRERRRNLFRKKPQISGTSRPVYRNRH